MLHVSVAGQGNIALALRERGNRRTQAADTTGEVERHVAQVQAQGGKHLVITRPAEMQASASLPDTCS